MLLLVLSLSDAARIQKNLLKQSHINLNFVSKITWIDNTQIPFKHARMLSRKETPPPKKYMHTCVSCLKQKKKQGDLSWWLPTEIELAAFLHFDYLL